LAVRILGILGILILAACSGPAATRPGHLPLTPPPREIVVSPEAANAFSERIQGAIHTQDATIEIEVREEELTSYLVLNAEDAGYKAMGTLRIWLTHDGIWVHIPVPLAPDRDSRAILKADDHLLALIRPTASEGALHVTIDAARWLGHALPRWLLTSIQMAANDALVDANLPMDVDQIVLDEGSLRIVLMPR
jgi:hypothetical protein